MPKSASIVVAGIAILAMIGAARCNRRSGPESFPPPTPAAKQIEEGPDLPAWIGSRPEPAPAAPATVEPAAAAPAKTAEPEQATPAPSTAVQPPARPVLTFVRGPAPVRIPPAGHPPVLSDVIARLPDPTYWRDQTEPTDLVTWTHEGSHGVCVRLPRVKGSHGIYLLNGLSVYLRHPRLTIGEAAATIPPNERGRIFNLYMVESRRDWDREPIYIVEEWVCYVHGTLARRQLGLDRREETESHALEMERYSRAILALAKRKDPTYADADKFAAFIEWNADRFRRFQKVEPVRIAGKPADAVAR
jgi:hypothetical protein